MAPVEGPLALKELLAFLVFSLSLCFGEGMVFVSTPENATFSFADADAAFGGIIPLDGIRGVLHKADPLDGCSHLGRAVTGKTSFALIERGNCRFDIKVRNAQLAGYAAVIVFNDENARMLITMSGPLKSDLYIPAVFVTNISGRQLLTIIDKPGITTTITPTFESTPWSVVAVSLISLLAVSAVLATFFFVRRHRLHRIGSRLLIARETPGMTPNEVKALPSFTYRAAGMGVMLPTIQGGTSETCVICLDDYESGDKLRLLPCHHEFHAICVDQWLTTRRPFCPVCKRDAHDASPLPHPTERTPLLAPVPQRAVFVPATSPPDSVATAPPRLAMGSSPSGSESSSTNSSGLHPLGRQAPPDEELVC